MFSVESYCVKVGLFQIKCDILLSGRNQLFATAIPICLRLLSNWKLVEIKRIQFLP